jgi:hypothetical protein
LRESERIVVLLGPQGLKSFPKDDVAAVRRSSDARDGPAGGASKLAKYLEERDAADSGAPGVPRKPSVRAVIERSNRRVALVLSGELAAKRLDAGDDSTIERLGGFLRDRCSPPLELVRPAEPGADSSVAAPQLRIRIAAQVRFGETFSFYGVDLGKRAECDLQFSLESLLDRAPRALVVGSSPGELVGSESDDAVLARRAYDLALTNLIQQLEKLPALVATSRN